MKDGILNYRRPPNLFLGMRQSIFFGVVCVLLLVAVETEEHDSESLDNVINSSHFGTVDFHELNEVLYDVEISNQPASEDEISPEQEVVMVSKHGQSFSCSLPKLPDDLEEKWKENEKLNATILPNISALLQPMQNEGCLTKSMGWWTYEYCHGHFVKQYHVEAGRVVGKSVLLGFYEEETQWDQKHVDRIKGVLNSLKKNIANGAAVAYHSVYYVNGTVCDLTGKPRMTTAKIYCGIGPDKLLDVHEKESCNYSLSIQSTRICSHPLFDMHAGTKKPHKVTCLPLLSREDYMEYLQQELLKMEKEVLDPDKESDKSEASQGDSSEHQLLKSTVVKSFLKILGSSTDLFDSGLDTEPETEIEELVMETLSRTSQDGQTSHDLNSQSGSSHSEVKKTSERSTTEADFESALAAIVSNIMKDTTTQQQSVEGTTHAIPKSISDNFETGDETGMDPHHGPLKDKLHQTTTQQTLHGHSRVESDHDPTVDSGKDFDSDVELNKDKSFEGLGVDVDLEDLDEDFDLGEDFDLDDLNLDEWDEEMLREVEKEVEDALQEQLTEAGFKGQAAEVKVKIITNPIQLTEELQDSEESDSGAVDKAKTLKETTNNLADSFLNLMNNLLGDDTMSEERQKQQNLEGSYERTWSNKPKKQGVKPR